MNPALHRERFDRRDDRAPHAIPVRLARDGDPRHLGNRWRVFLEGAAGDNPPPLVDADNIIVDRERDLLRRAAQHEILVGKTVVEPRDLFGVAREGRADANRLLRHQSTPSRICRPSASSSRVATSGGRRRTVYSPNA